MPRVRADVVSVQLALLEMPESAYRRRRCPVCRGALSVTATHTYVVQRQGWVKIGKTSQIDTRLRVLRLNGPNGAGMVAHPEAMDYGQPLILLALVEGDLEHQWHMDWRACHAAGEWFLPDSAMRDWLKKLCPTA
jgi:hypothetical protein